MTGDVTLNLGAPSTAPGPAAVVEVLHPRRAGGLFVGRVREVERLLRLLDPEEEPAGAVVVSAVSGMGGIGKTALAVHTAVLAAGRRWYEGGVLLVHLRGYDPEAAPVQAAQAYATLLLALNLPAEQLPGTAGQLAFVYHQFLDQLADQGKRVLLVLDNVAEAGQVEDLLPRHRAHRALVTTRDALDLPAARRVPLDVLSPAEAADLLNRTLLDADPADARPDREPEVVARLVRLCGLLPLAIEIAAAILADEPGSSIAGLAEQFAHANARLSGLRRARPKVTSVIDVSYRRLAGREPAAAGLLPLLTVNPGPDLATEAAAALAGAEPAETATLLRILRAASLLQYTAAGRWRLHDLVALYARRHLSEDSADTALDRLVDHYAEVTKDGDKHLHALDGQPLPDRFTGRDQALAWFDAERANIIALVTLTHQTRRYEETCVLASSVAEYLRWRRHLTDWITVAEHAAAAAAALGAPQRIATVLNRLGFALCAVRRFDEAIAAHQQARNIFRRFGDGHGEAMADNGLGLALSEVHRFDEAITAHEEARDIFRRFDDRHGEAVAWNNLGLARRELGRFPEAITAHERARDIHRGFNDPRGEAIACNGLGLALRQVGKAAEAVTAHEQAREIFGRLGDRYREALALNDLGLALGAAERFSEAAASHQQARDIFRQFGDRAGEATASGDLGSALRAAGQFEEAVVVHREDIESCRETGDRQGEGGAWNRLGLAESALGHFEEAVAAHRQARDIFRETGDHHGEGAAWNNLGIALRVLERYDEAITAHEEDLRIFRDFDARYGEGMAWNNLGIVLFRAGRLAEAVDAHRTAAVRCHEDGDQQGRGVALLKLGDAMNRAGDGDGALRAWAEAAEVFTETGDAEFAAEVRSWLPDNAGDGRRP